MFSYIYASPRQEFNLDTPDDVRGGVVLTDGNQHDYSTGSINAPFPQGVNGFYDEQLLVSLTGQSGTQSDFNQLGGPNESSNSVGLGLSNQSTDRETNQHSPAIYEDYSRALAGMSEQPGTQLQQDNVLIRRVRESRPVPIERPATPLSESSSKLKCHHPRCNHEYVYAQSQGLRKHERIKHNSPKRGPGRKRTRSAA
ncbi:hypothetical protein DTO280E4_1486 [Paecilomyces variotii]|nr:hypothetical protein DTO280E4_1486 [Paecilomyces variotii]KAJ9392872.1 hypothetical protein DTO063F5_9 [Paecilomyces variotii]